MLRQKVKNTLSVLSLNELKILATEFGLSSTGNRKELIAFLLDGEYPRQIDGTDPAIEIPETAIPGIVQKLSLNEAINLSSINKWWRARTKLIAQGLCLNEDDSATAYKIIMSGVEPAINPTGVGASQSELQKRAPDTPLESWRSSGNNFVVGTQSHPWSEALKYVRCLYLFNLPEVSDVSALGQIHTLELWNLPQVGDVSALGHVHTLTLFKLPLVSDVSALDQVHTLTLYKLPLVSDVSTLGQIHTLELRDLPKVSDVSALGHVHILTLYDLPLVSDVSALGQVHTLILYNLPLVSDVSALGQVHTLKLDNLPVEDVSALGQVHTLKLSYLPVSDISALSQVPNLILYGKLEDLKFW